MGGGGRSEIEDAGQTRSDQQGKKIILEAEFWADWSGKEVKGIKRQRLQ